MIRSHPFAVALISFLFVLSLVCAWCAGWWFLGVQELQQLNAHYQWMAQTSAAVQSLANEAIDYSRRNPAIEPLLKQFEVIPGRPAPAPSAASPAPAPRPPVANPTPKR